MTAPEDLVKVAFVKFSEPLPEDIYGYYLSQMPTEWQVRNQRFRRWQDQHTHLFGKVLLRHLALHFDGDESILETVYLNPWGKPFFQDSDLYFNISHSGDTVACAMAKGFEVGLDIQEYGRANFSSFRNIHSSQQWRVITQSTDPQRSFFDYWTKKECVVKGEGKGLSIPLQSIQIEKNAAICGQRVWHLQSPRIHDGVACSLATTKPLGEVLVEELKEPALSSLSL